MSDSGDMELVDPEVLFQQAVEVGLSPDPESRWDDSFGIHDGSAQKRLGEIANRERDLAQAWALSVKSGVEEPKREEFESGPECLSFPSLKTSRQERVFDVESNKVKAKKARGSGSKRAGKVPAVTAQIVDRAGYVKKAGRAPVQQLSAPRSNVHDQVASVDSQSVSKDVDVYNIPIESVECAFVPGPSVEDVPQEPIENDQVEPVVWSEAAHAASEDFYVPPPVENEGGVADSEFFYVPPAENTSTPVVVVDDDEFSFQREESPSVTQTHAPDEGEFDMSQYNAW